MTIWPRNQRMGEGLRSNNQKYTHNLEAKFIMALTHCDALGSEPLYAVGRVHHHRCMLMKRADLCIEGTQNKTTHQPKVQRDYVKRKLQN